MPTMLCMNAHPRNVHHTYTLHTTDYELTDEERRRFEELCEQKIKIVEERNDLVMQTEEERKR